jgi:2-oxoacid:acceptor oxidoreductase delta subunit (pyruvate/2-ketoisovalerate family)
MALMEVKDKTDAGPIFKTEGPWCDGSITVLSLPTGTWRTEHPVLDQRQCTYCGLCYLYCPPQCIHAEPEFFTIDLKFCKGCGICARECPTGAIAMVAKGEAAHGGG